MKQLSRQKQEAVVAALVEGCSLRSVARLTNVDRGTVAALLERIGVACAELHDGMMYGLPCGRLELDEIWTFVAKKQKHLRVADPWSRMGDYWVFVALDPDTKIVAGYLVGKRTARNTNAFVADLAKRLDRRVQLSTDGLDLYVEAIEKAFGGDVDVGTIIKKYVSDPIGPGRYSPPRVRSVEKDVMQGEPDPRFISTSLVERQNLTMRMNMRRFTRLTNAFSKKPEFLRHAVALHFAHYNFCRPHQTLRITPAMAARVTDKFWTVGDLLGLID